MGGFASPAPEKNIKNIIPPPKYFLHSSLTLKKRTVMLTQHLSGGSLSHIITYYDLMHIQFLHTLAENDLSSCISSSQMIWS